MSGVKARATIESAVRRELFGPDPAEPPRGKPLDCSSGKISFKTREESWGIWHEATSGQEILTESDPLRRYGVGILFPGRATRAASTSQSEPSAVIANDLSGTTGLSTTEVTPDVVVQVGMKEAIPAWGESDADDFDLSDANSFKPSAMAISFQCNVENTGHLAVSISGAYYDRIEVEYPGLRKPRIWWVRRPFTLHGNISAELLTNEIFVLKSVSLDPPADLRVTPNLQVFSRPVPGSSASSTVRLVTLAATNSAPGSGPSATLFQMSFDAAAHAGVQILPYPEAVYDEFDEEEQSTALLYRNKRTYAIGHGCAANWSLGANQTAQKVIADPLPAHEIVSLTPNIYKVEDDGRRVRVTVSMEELANWSEAGRAQVGTVLDLYEEWIAARKSEISSLPLQFQHAAKRHMSKCDEAMDRMRKGWDLASEDPIANRAFRLANQAMLEQQRRSSLPRREVDRLKDGRLTIPTPHPKAVRVPGKGDWRPFQIAFLLATLPELVDRSAATRPLVDLIFFPTGGGKTEAYLGASAISLLARRIRDKTDVGTDTIMRYTLRLLTAQQFLRAATLICVLEDIRSKHEDILGTASFGIGIWLGGTSTPNTWGKAIDNLSELRRNSSNQNKFLLLRCPWCGTEMGPKRRPRSGQDVIGYEQVGKKVEFRCLDSACRFGGRRKLPIHVVDEDIYSTRPSIVIGTVDKFAMLAWRPEARSIFGIERDGSRNASPPGLIIQDELHLISGPLGSMVGLYEPMIEDLCTDTRDGNVILPKIIASTATIRRYKEQVRGIFGRKHVALFPPHGLEEGHSFFAEPATLENGEPEPGRRYLGVMSASLGSTQTVQVRVAAATLQGAIAVPEAHRDGYWTNLNFLNSLRELGNTVSLIQSDIPDYITGLRRRDNLTSPRWPRIPMELTSRRRSDEIPKAIEQLQLKYPDPHAIDICLASNIIEVGVDIDRLGLMTIVGQPKTTAQYIQVSGRVGRRPDHTPGLVITIYGAAKPRDRSHYERFHTYHQQLYAQVEPTSVTPFARPVIDRALHAAIVSHIRQSSEQELSVYPFPENEFSEATNLLRKRAAVVDPGELDALDRRQGEISLQWRRWDRTEWDANVIGGDPKQGLMRYAGTLPDLEENVPIWDVPTSMRNVDAECRLEISLDYNMEATTGAREEFE